MEKVFTISVANVNEAPTDILLSNSSLPENALPNATVGTLSATDPDVGSTFTYSLPAGMGDNAAFNISGTTLRATSSLNYEAKSSYTVTVRVTDAGGLTFNKTFLITVTNVNEAPTNILLSNSSLPENAGVNATVGTLSATDPDAGSTFTFSLPAGVGDNASFNISGTTLRATSSFDFETKSSYSVTVRVADAAGLTFDKAFTIGVTNVNEAPTDITLSVTTVPENQPIATIVGLFSTTDPDAGNTFTYSLVAGTGSTDNASFTIDASGNLKTAASFDFETKSSYSIRVRSTDQGALFVEKVFTIGVTNVNETPTDITLSVTTVPENQPVATVVGVFSTTDPDAGNTFTYSLVAGTGSTDNASFTIDTSGNLKTAESFDFETKSSYSIRVRSTDQGALFVEKFFTISVTNVNETPTNITLSASTVAENEPIATIVGLFSTTDPDAGNTFTYSLVAGTGSTDNASFTIDTSGNLKTAASFDFETKSSYSIRVRSTDQGALFVEKVFTVGVTNVNETPTDIALSVTTVAENQPIATIVGLFSTTDPDAGNTFTYALVAGTGSTDNASFTIDASGNLKTAASFDFETKSSYSIRVRSTDQGALFVEKVFTIGVTDVDDTPGFDVSAISGNTTEAGGTATFTVKLKAQPTANVTIGLTSDDTTEGTIDKSSLTFTTANWNVAQTVTVTGVNDLFDDGDIVYHIVTAPASSIDPGYNNLNPADVTVTNIDNDTVANAPDLDELSDLGVSNTDNLTNVIRPVINGNGIAGQTVVLFDGNTQIGSAVIGGAGTYSITLGNPLSEGSHTITAKLSDGAGNFGSASSPLTIVIDITAPIAPLAPDLAATSDSGDSNIDNLTNDTTPTFIGTGTAGDGIHIFSDGALVGTGVVDSQGNYAVTVSTALFNGPTVITAYFTDPAGNQSSVSAPLNIEIDTTPPAAPSVPDLTAASDTGVLNDDNLTNDTTPTFTGTGINGDTIRIYRGGNIQIGSGIVSGGVYTITLDINTLASGTHSLTARATDPAGNEGDPSAALSVTIDTTAPTAPAAPDLAASSDTGKFNDDNLTDVTDPVFAGTGVAGDVVRIFIANVLSGSGVVAANGTYSVAVSIPGEGPHSITASFMDPAGNTSTLSAALTVTIDRTAPGVLAGQIFSVAENTANNINVNGGPVVEDPNETVTLYWAIVDPLGIFQIDEASGQISVKNKTPLNYETLNDGNSANGELDANDRYHVTVTVSDGVRTSNATDVGITVTDVQGPEISVRVLGAGGEELNLVPDDTGLVDFGVTPLNTSVTRTFRIRNDGDADLVIGTITLPAGFTLSSPPSTSLIGQGTSSDFTIEFNGPTVGSFAGELSFDTNEPTDPGVNADGNVERPYNFTIKGAVVGADITVKTHGGNVADDAILSVPTLFAGQTHTQQFVITNTGITPLVISEISVSGTQFSVTGGGLASGGTPITLQPNSGSHVVTLFFNSANLTERRYVGTLTIRSNDFDEDPFTASLNTEIIPAEKVWILDDGDAGFTQGPTGPNWVTSGGTGSTSDSGYAPAGGNRDYRYSSGSTATVGGGGGKAVWSFTGLSTGVFRVAATWPDEVWPVAAHARDTLTFGRTYGDAPYSIYNGAAGAGTPLETTIVNQYVAPDDFEVAGVRWEDLGIVQITGTQLDVALSTYTDAASRDEVVIADAVRIERIEPRDDVFSLATGRSQHDLDVRRNDGYPASWTFKSATISTDLGGTVTVAADGTLRYVPPTRTTVGRDHFTYQLTSGTVDSRVVHVDLVLSVGAPTLVNDSFEVSRGSQLTFDVTANDFDPEGDRLIPVITEFEGAVLQQTSPTAIDTFHVVTPGEFYFTAAPGVTTFSLNVTRGANAPVTVSLNLSTTGSTTDAVLVRDQMAAALGLTQAEIEVMNVTQSPNVFRVRQVSGGNQSTSMLTATSADTAKATVSYRGTLVTNSDGTFRYTPNRYYYIVSGLKTEVLYYSLVGNTADDTRNERAPGRIELKVGNTAPTASALADVQFSYQTLENIPQRLALHAADTDGDPLFVVFSLTPVSAGTYPVPITFSSTPRGPAGSVFESAFTLDSAGSVLAEARADSSLSLARNGNSTTTSKFRIFDGTSYSKEYSARFVGSRDGRPLGTTFPFDAPPVAHLSSSDWSLTAADAGGATSAGHLEAVGDSQIRMDDGAVITSLPLDANEQYGTGSEFSLVRNSQRVDSRPVITGTINVEKIGTARDLALLKRPHSIELMINWWKYDSNGIQMMAGQTQTDLNLNSGTAAELSQAEIPFAIQANDRFVLDSTTGTYRWQVTAKLKFTAAPDITLRQTGDLAVVRTGGIGPYAGLPKGWSLNGIPQLVIDRRRPGDTDPLFGDDRITLIDGNGSLRMFRRPATVTNPSAYWPAYNPVTGAAIPDEFGRLRRVHDNSGPHNDDTWQFLTPDGGVYNFDKDGLLLSKSAPGVPGTTFAYDESRRLTTITAWDGSFTTLNYDSGDSLAGLSSIELPGGRFVSISTTSGRMNSFQLGNVRREFLYDSSGNLTFSLWKNGAATVQATAYAYSSNVIEKVILGVAPDVNGNLPASLPANSALYDVKPKIGFRVTGQTGYKLSGTVPLTKLPTPADFKAIIRTPSTDLRKYDGSVAGAAWTRTLETHYELDDRGRLEILDEVFAQPNGVMDLISREQWDYDVEGNVTTHIDALNRDTHFKYDYTSDDPNQLHQLHFGGNTSTDPNDLYQWNYDYDRPVLYQTAIAYDSAKFGAVTEVFYGYRQMTYQINSLTGSVVSETDALGRTTTYLRNSNDLVTKIIGPAGYTEEWIYNSANPSTALREELTLQKHISALGLETVFDLYDARYRPGKSTASHATLLEPVTTTFAYDDFSRTVTTTTTTGAVRGTAVQGFDDLDRLQFTELYDVNSGGTLLSSVAYQYIGSGLTSLITTIRNGLQVFTKQDYDLRGFATDTWADWTGPDQQLTHTDYYQNGSIQKLTYPDLHTDTYFYDVSPGYLYQAYIDWVVTDRVADDLGAETAKSVTQTLRARTGRVQQVEQFIAVGAADPVSHGLQTLDYDQQDRLLRRTNQRVFVDLFAFMDQLPTAEIDIQQTFSWDAVGNLRSSKRDGLAGSVVDYNNLDQAVYTAVLANGGAASEQQYDMEGNLTASKQYRLTPTVSGVGVVTGYSASVFSSASTYDALGRPVQSTQNAAADGLPTQRTITDYEWDFNNGKQQSSEKMTVRIEKAAGSNAFDQIITTQYADAAGQMRESVDASGTSTLATYDEQGNTISVSIPSLNRRTEFTFDNLGRQRQVIQRGLDPMDTTDDLVSKTDYFTSHPEGWDVIVTDPKGSQTKSRFDSLGQIQRVQQPAPGNGADGTPDHAAATINYDYDYSDQGVIRVELHDAIGLTTISDINDLGWTFQSVDRTGKQMAFMFDAAGRIVRSSLVAQNQLSETSASTWSYDIATGQVSEFRNEDQVAADEPGVRTVYDSVGNVISLVNEKDEQTLWQYDGFNRPVSETITVDVLSAPGVKNGVTKVRRNWLYEGFTTMIEDRHRVNAAGAPTAGEGRKLTTVANPASRTVTENWHPSTVTFADIRTGATVPLTSILTTANAAGQMLSTSTYVPGTIVAGNLKSQVIQTYDEFGRADISTQDFTTSVGSLDAPAFTLDRSYNSTTGLISSANAALNGTVISTTSWLFDNLNRPYGVTQHMETDARALWLGTGGDSQPGSVGTDNSVWIEYRADGSRADMLRNDGLSYSQANSDVMGRTQYAYNADGQLTSLVHRRDFSTGAISGHIFRFDNRGLLDQEKTLYYDVTVSANPIAAISRDQRYRYDASGQLNQIGVGNLNDPGAAPAWGPVIEYDAAGNRKGDFTTIGLANRILRDARGEYQYDDIGNQTVRDRVPDIVDDQNRAAPSPRLQLHGVSDFTDQSNGLGGTQGTFSTGHVVAKLDRVPGNQPAAAGKLEPGEYDIWATWTPNFISGLGSGEFDLYKTATQLPFPEWSRTIDFASAPNDAFKLGVFWKLLGTVTIHPDESTALDLKLTPVNGGKVLFDAVVLSPKAQRQTYTWDHRNRLNEVQQLDFGGRAVGGERHQYDALNRRIATTVTELNPVTGTESSSLTTGRFFDDQGVAFEVEWVDQGGTPTARIRQATFNGVMPNEVFAVDMARDAATTRTAWAFADHQGSVQSWTIENAPGFIVMHQQFSAFGSPSGGYHNFDPFDVLNDPAFRDSIIEHLPTIWAGHRVDLNTGLADMQARWRDTGSGVFLSEDPISYAGGDSNLYRYAFNSPGNFVDPDGNEPITIGVVLTYLATTGFSAVVDTGAEYAFTRAVGTQDDIDNFSFLATFAKNWAINIGTVGVGSKLKYGKLALGPVSRFALREGFEYSVDVGVGTGYDVYVNDRSFGQALGSNAFGSAIGRGFGHGLSTIGRNVPQLNPANYRWSVSRNSFGSGVPLEANFVAPGKASTSIGELRRTGQRDAHHVIQDAAVRDLPGYNTNAAPGVRLDGPANVPGTPHNLTRPVQRQRGGGTYGSERRISYKALRRAGKTPDEARQLVDEADEYFSSIGVDRTTPTGIPGDRR